MTYTPSNVIQYNEYYPFGMNTANSCLPTEALAKVWTRENTTGNNFLGNGGTEFNNTSNLYDLDYRNYDPILGRMNGVDPVATKYASLSPYNFSFNNPVTFNDPSGADPYQRSDDTWWVAPRGSQGRFAGYGSYENWRRSTAGAFSMSSDPWAWTGMSSTDIYGPAFSMGGVGVSYGGGSGSTAQMNADARAVQENRMSIADYAAKYGTSASSISIMQVRHEAMVLTNAYGEPMADGEVIAGATYWYYDEIELKQLTGLVGNRISGPGFVDNSWRTPWHFTDAAFYPDRVTATNTDFEQLDFVVGTGFSNTAQIGHYNAKMQAYNYTSTRAQFATQLRGAKYLNIGAKGLGVLGGFIGGIQSFSDGNFTIGDASKMVFSIAMVFTGPFGIAYTVADIAVGFGTGYSITDRIGIGVDYSLSR